MFSGIATYPIAQKRFLKTASMGAVIGGWVVIDTFVMQIDAHTLSDILVAHRRAMALYRKECMPLGRNAIEVMLYTYGKSGVTVTEVSRNLLHSNVSQTKRILAILISNGLLWSFGGDGLKGRPRYYCLTERGMLSVSHYWEYYRLN